MGLGTPSGAGFAKSDRTSRLSGGEDGVDAAPPFSAPAAVPPELLASKPPTRPEKNQRLLAIRLDTRPHRGRYWPRTGLPGPVARFGSIGSRRCARQRSLTAVAIHGSEVDWSSGRGTPRVASHAGTRNTSSLAGQVPGHTARAKSSSAGLAGNVSFVPARIRPQPERFRAAGRPGSQADRQHTRASEGARIACANRPRGTSLATYPRCPRFSETSGEANTKAE